MMFEYLYEIVVASHRRSKTQHLFKSEDFLRKFYAEIKSESKFKSIFLFYRQTMIRLIYSLLPSNLSPNFPQPDELNQRLYCYVRITTNTFGLWTICIALDSFTIGEESVASTALCQRKTRFFKNPTK